MEEKEKRLLQGGLTFFGRITANISHEINNVITIVGEVAGLLDDLVEMAEEGIPLPLPKLQQQVEKISRQVARGKGIIKQMNRFAHTIDDLQRELDLNEVLGRLVHLTQRLASLKNTSLQMQQAETPLPLTRSPFLVQQAIYLCLDLLLEANATSEPIVFITRSHERGVLLEVQSVPWNLTPLLQEKLSYLELVAAELGAELSSSTRDGHHSFTLLFLRA